jgi:hypothetical protein
MHRPTVGFLGVAVSYERGTPVRVGVGSDRAVGGGRKDHVFETHDRTHLHLHRGSGFRVYRGTSFIKKTPTPSTHAGP